MAEWQARPNQFAPLSAKHCTRLGGRHMTALLDAAHHALAFTAPVPEAAMFAAPWVVLLAAVGIYRAAAAARRRVRGGWLDERTECWHG